MLAGHCWPEWPYWQCRQLGRGTGWRTQAAAVGRAVNPDTRTLIARLLSRTGYQSGRAAQYLRSLFSPLYWKPPQQVLELQVRRLPSTEDRLDDIGRQQG